MIRVLLIALVWLSIGALVGVVIGRAIHLADLRDEQLSRRSRSTSLLRIRIGPPHSRSARGPVCAEEILGPADADANHRLGNPRPRQAPPSTDDQPPGHSPLG
jgi:hypothetical protein